jgi:hypothetical protein
MLEVTAHLLDQTWESSLVPTERPMLQHQWWWHLVSYTSLGVLSWNQISPCSSSLNQMTMTYLMSSPCWSHHLGVFSREDWTCRAMSMSMLLVQSTYTGFDPISYHSQRWCFQWSDMVIENSLFRKYGWVVDVVIIWSIGLANALMLLKSTIRVDHTQKIILEDLMMSWFGDVLLIKEYHRSRLFFIDVRLYTSDAYVFFIGVTFLIIIDSGQWLYLIVIFIKVNVITVVSSLRAKIGINTIFSLSKKFKSIIFDFL